MKAAIISFTGQGVALGSRILNVLRDEGHEAWGLAPEKHAKSGFSPFASVGEAARENFERCDCLVFVGACGIAVRAIAPHLRDKTTDPAVLVCDEAGLFVIPLLSGHIGGANEIAHFLARAIEATLVITTATDLRGVFAVDVWAKRAGLVILNKERIKEVSSRLLNDEKVGFTSKYPVRGTPPPGIGGEDCECGICIGPDVAPFPVTLNLAPKNLVAGCGCRKGASGQQIKSAFETVFGQHGLDLRRLSKVCSIDLKAGEPGLLEFAGSRKLETVFYSAEELAGVKGTFVPSEVVLRVTGVDNVCERAAVLGGGTGRLTVPKSISGGVTVAVFERDCVVEWDA